MEGRNTCFKYSAPLSFSWLITGQNRGNGVTQKEGKGGTLKGVFFLCLIQQLASPVEPALAQF